MPFTVTWLCVSLRPSHLQIKDPLPFLSPCRILYEIRGNRLWKELPFKHDHLWKATCTSLISIDLQYKCTCNLTKHPPTGMESDNLEGNYLPTLKVSFIQRFYSRNSLPSKSTESPKSISLSVTNRDNSVNKVTGYWLDYSGSIPVRAEVLSVRQYIQACSRAHQSSCPVGTIYTSCIVHHSSSSSIIFHW